MNVLKCNTNNEPWHEIFNKVVCATSKASDQTAHTSDFCVSLEYSRSVKILTEHHLEFLSLTGGCTGSFESTLVKMPHCWKSHVTAQFIQAVTCLQQKCVVERIPNKRLLFT